MNSVYLKRLLWRQNLLIQVEANVWHMANSTAFSIIILVGLSCPYNFFLSQLFTTNTSLPSFCHQEHLSDITSYSPGQSLIPAPKSKLNDLHFRWWEKKSSETGECHSYRNREWQRWKQIPGAHNFAFRTFLAPGRDLYIFVEQKMYPYALHKALFLDMIKGWQ